MITTSMPPSSRSTWSPRAARSPPPVSPRAAAWNASLPLADVGLTHLGVACRTRDDVDRLASQARARGITVDGPHDSPAPVGYWAILEDPDGHALELSHGQDIESLTKQAGQNP